MSSNFNFLKQINKDLYEIIFEAEKLYGDEYFEQCITQTRRFGEQMCRTMLEENGIKTGSFDNMLAVLQDKSQGSIQEKEFIEDLYFLKKNGNKSVHSSKVEKKALTALECLKRSFEAAINYSVYNKGASSRILKLDYDVDLLILNKKSDSSLKQRYGEAKHLQKQKTASVIGNDKLQTKKTLKKEVDFKENTLHIPMFWKFIIFLSCISFSAVIILSLWIALKKRGLV